MGLEERNPGEVLVRLGAATKAVQRVLQAAVEFGAAEQGAEFHLRGRRPQPISERRDGRRVRRGRNRLAHCARGLGEVSGRPGMAGSVGVRICGAGTPRYAASPWLGGRTGGRMGGMLAGGARQERTEGLGGASSANCAEAQGAAGGERLPVHWHNIAGGDCSSGGKGVRGRGASVPGTVGEHAGRTPRCHRGSAPPRGSCSQAGGPLQRARPLAARAVGSLSEYGGQRRVRRGGVNRTSSARDAGRRTCRRRGRMGASLRAIKAGASEQRRSQTRVVRQTQIDPRDRPCRIHPAGEVCPACPVPRTHFGHHLPYTTPPLPYYHPRAPTSTSPVSDCTVPCHVMVHPEYAYSSALLWEEEEEEEE